MKIKTFSIYLVNMLTINMHLKQNKTLLCKVKEQFHKYPQVAITIVKDIYNFKNYTIQSYKTDPDFSGDAIFSKMLISSLEPSNLCLYFTN